MLPGWTRVCEPSFFFTVCSSGIHIWNTMATCFIRRRFTGWEIIHALLLIKFRVWPKFGLLQLDLVVDTIIRIFFMSITQDQERRRHCVTAESHCQSSILAIKYYVVFLVCLFFPYYISTETEKSSITQIFQCIKYCRYMNNILWYYCVVSYTVISSPIL